MVLPAFSSMGGYLDFKMIIKTYGCIVVRCKLELL